VDLSEKSVAVAEISSFQLETLQSLCPHIAVVLNLTEDHLSRHYNMENYAFLKAKLLKNCSEMEYAVLNYDDEIVREFAQKTKAKIVWFSLKERVRGAYFENGDLYFGTEKVISSADLCLEGAHNVQNALAVIAAAKIMGVDTQILAKSLSNFQGIKHRIEKVGVVGDVLCIDDSKGTNVDATIKAMQCMKTQTVLLLGGKNKGYDYTKLFFAMKKYPIAHAVLYGENRFELLKSAQAGTFENFTLCDKFALAVEIAFLKAKAGQTILLSPASASFDEFASYEERGDKFVEIVCAHAKKREIIENSKEEGGTNIEKEQSKTEPTIVCDEHDEPLHGGEEHAKENRFAPVGEENE
jgi:UDP-N-acetylmuramoylalanine--D-glutamate ligase